MTTLFPHGISSYLVGGLLIGVAVSFIFLVTGIRAGASSFFTAVLSYVSSDARIRQERWLRERGWRTVFSIGLVVGAAVFATFVARASFTTDVQPWRLLAGGFLVGLGTRLSRGCTSGHGICGLASFSKGSLIAVVTFLAVAIGTAHVVSALGVLP